MAPERHELTDWDPRPRRREALIDALDDLAHAAGLRGKDLGKAWRDW